MTARDFVYWLQGFFELHDPTALSPLQVQIIKEHLALVFEKETPNHFQGILNGLPHTGGIPLSFPTLPYTGDPLPSQYPTITSHMPYEGYNDQPQSPPDPIISC